MPIYEFLCRDCMKPFEKLVSTSMRDSATCVHCGSSRTARKISLTAPAQIRSTSATSQSMGESCGQPSCCGGGCGLPN